MQISFPALVYDILCPRSESAGGRGIKVPEGESKGAGRRKVKVPEGEARSVVLMLSRIVSPSVVRRQEVELQRRVHIFRIRCPLWPSTCKITTKIV